ncbi:hypothetical protein [Methanimicrococcus hongohii]|uniref:hypothetical protein n=1 Tax=Methanimicrococcus hongohii TaxID=3028295 RepID=UPI00292EBD98|nr:hypothetical protein [Methanimicrococcus sp. Hf6]
MRLSFAVNWLSLPVCNCLLRFALAWRFALPLASPVYASACICSFFKNPFAFANVPLLPLGFCFHLESGFCFRLEAGFCSRLESGFCFRWESGFCSPLPAAAAAARRRVRAAQILKKIKKEEHIFKKDQERGIKFKKIKKGEHIFKKSQKRGTYF